MGDERNRHNLEVADVLQTLETSHGRLSQGEARQRAAEEAGRICSI